MACYCDKQTCCHAVGITMAVLSTVLLIGGFVLIIVFSNDFDKLDSWTIQYSVGIGAISFGTILAFCSLIYICCALRYKWQVYGCIKMKAPDKHIAGMFSASHLPSKEEIDVGFNKKGSPSNQVSSLYTRPSHYNGASEKYNKTDGSRETEWDPDTILGDD